MASSDNNKHPQYPYYFQPPTWPDPYPSSPSLSSSSSSIPKWVIAAIAVAVAISIFFLFLYIRKREKKIKKKCKTGPAVVTNGNVVGPPQIPATNKTTSDSGSTTIEKVKKPSNTDTSGKPENNNQQKTKPHPTPQEQIYVPNTCPRCGLAGGMYTFNYLCTRCKYKSDYSFSYPGP